MPFNFRKAKLAKVSGSENINFPPTAIINAKKINNKKR